MRFKPGVQNLLGTPFPSEHGWYIAECFSNLSASFCRGVSHPAVESSLRDFSLRAPFISIVSSEFAELTGKLADPVNAGNLLDLKTSNDS
jgi:hypothetical protein